MYRFKVLSLVLVCLCFLTIAGKAQTTTGTISGTVLDSSGHVIAGATAKLISERTREQRTILTSDEGVFTFAAVQPGVYTVRVENKGFRVFERTGNVLPAAEHLSVGTIEMSVGEVSEAVTTQAEGAVVQTETSEHSALITSDQLQTIAIRGRDVISMLRILPGVSQQVDTGSSAAISALEHLIFRDHGQPGTACRLTALLATIWELRARSRARSISMQSARSKVQLNNYQAEYGRNGGSFVNIITKSGSQEFHGSGYWYKRHESFNANDFFNNRDKISKPIYRHSTLGFTVGGPIYIPRHFNTDKDKLFFFYSFEHSWVKNPQAVRQVTVPTELERAGNFSQTLDQNGRLIVIRDPVTNLPFQNNIIPTSRINRYGQSILNIFPTPNQLNRAITGGNFNYQFQESINQPRHQHLLRVDWRPTEKDSVSVRGSTWYADSIGHAVAGWFI